MDGEYTPMMSSERSERLRRWHQGAYEGLRQRGTTRMSYLSTDLVVPHDVFAPTPTSDLLGTAVLDEVRETDRVLDMGTGSGVNAILAASRSHDVVGVDINPSAIAAAIANAERNGVAERTTFFQSDVFERVDGLFDLIVVDPPFRWFAPRDLLEASSTDENYRALTRFMSQARGYLTPAGRILLFFGSSGDIDYLKNLVAKGGFHRETIGSRALTKDDFAATYWTFRLSP